MELPAESSNMQSGSTANAARHALMRNTRLRHPSVCLEHTNHTHRPINSPSKVLAHPLVSRVPPRAGVCIGLGPCSQCSIPHQGRHLMLGPVLVGGSQHICICCRGTSSPCCRWCCWCCWCCRCCWCCWGGFHRCCRLSRGLLLLLLLWVIVPPVLLGTLLLLLLLWIVPPVLLRPLLRLLRLLLRIVPPVLLRHLLLLLLLLGPAGCIRLRCQGAWLLCWWCGCEAWWCRCCCGC